jgi:hypothetical protein
VGAKKRLEILNEAKSKSLKLANVKNIDSEIKKYTKAPKSSKVESSKAQKVESSKAQKVESSKAQKVESSKAQKVESSKDGGKKE